jgi:hypothetical protein
VVTQVISNMQEAIKDVRRHSESKKSAVVREKAGPAPPRCGIRRPIAFPTSFLSRLGNTHAIGIARWRAPVHPAPFDTPPRTVPLRKYRGHNYCGADETRLGLG